MHRGQTHRGQRGGLSEGSWNERPGLSKEQTVILTLESFSGLGSQHPPAWAELLPLKSPFSMFLLKLLRGASITDNKTNLLQSILTAHPSLATASCLFSLRNLSSVSFLWPLPWSLHPRPLCSVIHPPQTPALTPHSQSDSPLPDPHCLFKITQVWYN